VIPFRARSFVQDNIETAIRRDDKLLQLFVSMPPSRLPAWNVVEVVHPLDLKRYVAVFFDKGEITSVILHPWKLN
jgi:hypothetical protein